MATVKLDSGDAGVQWVEGVGFRPVDVSEWYAHGQKFCGHTDNGSQCHAKTCTHEKWEFFAEPDLPTETVFNMPVYSAYTPPSATPTIRLLSGATSTRQATIQRTQKPLQYIKSHLR